MNSSWTDELAQAIFDFNGKSTEVLERFAAAHQPQASLVAALCDFAVSDDRNVQAAATWLLKRFRVTGEQLSPSQCDSLLRLLLLETSWLCHIHILQMMDSLVVPPALAAPLMDALDCSR